MSDLKDAARQALKVLEHLAEDAEEECGEETCPDCQAWRPVWATIAALKTALTWMKATRKTDSPPTVEDFDVIKRSSHWAAFEAGCLMEREACAKLADSMRDKTSQYADYLGDVGEAIRSRT